MKDYYSILGIDENAGESLIKSSYRKLAAICHPDKNPENQDKFIDISEAYKTLSDVVLRSSYDRELKEYRAFKNAQSENKITPYRTRLRGGANVNIIMDFTDDIGQIFKTAAYKNKNKDDEENIGSYEETIEKIISVERYIKCPSCGGEGKERGTITMACPECRGTGTIKNRNSGVTELCRNCDGYGDIFLYKCKICNGMARVKTSEQIKLNFAANELLGCNNIVFEGKGDAGVFGGKNGNLNVFAKIDENVLNKINNCGKGFLNKLLFFKK